MGIVTIESGGQKYAPTPPKVFATGADYVALFRKKSLKQVKVRHPDIDRAVLSKAAEQAGFLLDTDKSDTPDVYYVFTRKVSELHEM